MAYPGRHPKSFHLPQHVLGLGVGKAGWHSRGPGLAPRQLTFASPHAGSRSHGSHCGQVSPSWSLQFWQVPYLFSLLTGSLGALEIPRPCSGPLAVVPSVLQPRRDSIQCTRAILHGAPHVHVTVPPWWHLALAPKPCKPQAPCARRLHVVNCL